MAVPLRRGGGIGDAINLKSLNDNAIKKNLFVAASLKKVDFLHV